MAKRAGIELWEDPLTRATSAASGATSSHLYRKRRAPAQHFGYGRHLENGAPAAPAALVRTFTCSAADSTNVETVLGRAPLAGELQAAVERAAKLAVQLGTDGASALRASPRTAATNRFFQEAFSVSPDFVPPRRPAGATWRDLGELVAIRLSNAVRILEGGFIRYFCWGNPTHCPECPDDPPGYFACSSFGIRYVICIGTAFWRVYAAGDFDTMASTLLHEALHIYFGTTVTDDGRTGNANCYERFVIRLAGRFLHPATAANCPSAVEAPAVTDFPTVRRGSRGAVVQKLQVRLNAWRAANPTAFAKPLGVDGIFGALTEAAVLVFQRRMGIKVDGIVGPQTWGHLIAATPGVVDREREDMVALPQFWR
jgi:hypothetical protein